jgi:hypothetical protein
MTGIRRNDWNKRGMTEMKGNDWNKEEWLE